MYLTETQLDILRTWAEQTPQVQEAHLFGSYAKGEARADSARLRCRLNLSNGEMGGMPNQAMGVKVNIRTLALPNVRRYCQEFSMPIKG